MQLQNLFWVPQWVYSGDFSFPEDTSSSVVLTGVLSLNVTFKNERMMSANYAAKDEAFGRPIMNQVRERMDP